MTTEESLKHLSLAASISAPTWAVGDLLGLPIPAYGQALREGGESFLTKAFRASGVLSPDNRVAEISRFDEFFVGGTGSKAILDVRYEQPCALPTELFVKFSRNFQDPIRDNLRHMLESEIRFRFPGRRTALYVRRFPCARSSLGRDAASHAIDSRARRRRRCPRSG
jgi:hypothetical protein